MKKILIVILVFMIFSASIFGEQLPKSAENKQTEKKELTEDIKNNNDYTSMFSLSGELLYVWLGLVPGVQFSFKFLFFSINTFISGGIAFSGSLLIGEYDSFFEVFWGIFTDLDEGLPFFGFAYRYWPKNGGFHMRFGVKLIPIPLNRPEPGKFLPAPFISLGFAF